MKSQPKNRRLVLMQHRTGPDPVLMAGFQNLTRHLPKDPHPTLWRNRRRAEGEALRVPGENAVRAMELALDAAFLAGGRAIEATAQECDNFIEAIRARGMRRYIAYANGDASPQSAGLATMKEMTEAMYALTEAMAVGGPSATERAVKELRDVFRPAMRWCSAAMERPAARAAP